MCLKNGGLFTGCNIKMFVRSFLLCLGYFNNFFILEPIVIFFQVSSLIGQALVNKFLAICNCTFEIVQHTYSFFQILYEDSLIFLKDATEKFAFAISLLKELYIFLEESAWNLFKAGLRVVEIVFYFFEFIHNIVFSVKEVIRLTGSTVWLFFTNTPKAVFSNIVGTVELLTNTLNETFICIFNLKDKSFESLKKIYLFFFDVPLESVYGLIIGAVFLILTCVMFKNICYFISRTFFKLCQFAISFGISLWNGSFLECKLRRRINFSLHDDERLCVICQYQLKEVIIFPCRHLCLCWDCSIELSKNQPLCPICRSEIIETLRVYI